VNRLLTKCQVLGRVGVSGRPQPNVVWRHLQHLRDLSQRLERNQLQDFLSDLHATYQYLQDHGADSSITPNLRGSAIWLNVDDYKTLLLEDAKTSWLQIGKSHSNVYLELRQLSSPKIVLGWPLTEYDKLTLTLSNR
jgi:hypothetical protein